MFFFQKNLLVLLDTMIEAEKAGATVRFMFFVFVADGRPDLLQFDLMFLESMKKIRS